MSIAAPRTPDLETRKRLVSEMIRLSVWYVHQLLVRSEISAQDLPEALTHRVSLFRLTHFGDGSRDPGPDSEDPDWARLREELARLILAAPAEDAPALEESGLALLWPAVEPRLSLDVGPPCQRPFGCWACEPAWEGIGDGPGWLGKLSNPTHVAQKLRRLLGLPLAPSRGAVLHFENAFTPRSPFTRMPDLISSLRDLIAECRHRQPAVRTLWSDSWMNSHPLFLSLFPDSWRRSAVPCPPGNSFNWWGQFVNQAGDFAYPTAARFRASGGQFPFPALLCHASLDEIDQHLAHL